MPLYLRLTATQANGQARCQRDNNWIKVGFETATGAWNSGLGRLCTDAPWYRAPEKTAPLQNEIARQPLAEVQRSSAQTAPMAGAIELLCGSGESRSRGQWRRGWDSNPRYGFPYTRFPSGRLKPLGHPSDAPPSCRRGRIFSSKRRAGRDRGPSRPLDRGAAD